MNSLKAGCVLFIVSLCTAQRSPSITYISEDQTADVGSTVELACSVQYAGSEYSVIWMKNGQSRRENIFLSTGTSLVVKESRFALLYDGASATYIVLIKDLQETDAGVYQCEVVLSVNNKITAETRLSVRRPPIITDNSTQSIVTTEGQSIRMECYASGFPPPKIVWRRENNAILPTGKKFSSVHVGSIIICE
jgi:neuronal growth regulator 1